jgi:hypothetical protein
MRKLSPTFLLCLKSGFLFPITQQVRCDHDLSLDIRENYINIYFKGNSLLKLAEINSLIRYKADIHPKFLEGMELPLELTEETVPLFIENIPHIKQNIIKHAQGSLELEYEQLIIRANNFEPRNNTEYFIVDRQYMIGEDRFDLTGMFWDRNNRRKNQEVPVCLLEIKFALNPDIQQVHDQLAKYYEIIKSNPASFAEEMQGIFRQKLSLGLYHQSVERINAMKTLTFSTDLKDFQFVIILVDYNQNSTLFTLDKVRKLPFADKVRIFHTGFGMWQENVRSPFHE